VISNLLKVMPSNQEQSGRVSRGRNGHPSTNDWEKHKAEIVSLYEGQDNSLDEVARLMEAKHHFIATYAVPSQFKFGFGLLVKETCLQETFSELGSQEVYH
jgi:hypothetical protein